jgi:tripartite-type tricarboxylate transporter receptor subunit TctC
VDRRAFLIGAAGVSAGIGGLTLRSARAAGANMRFVYPYAPGSGGDVLVRLLADDLQKKLGVTAIVENRTGADGRIGVRDVKQAEADGSTLLFTPFGTMVLFPSVFKQLPYDAFADFTPVTQVVTYDFGLAAGPMTKVKTLAELIEWLKANPDKGNVGVPGLGALPHLLPLKFAADAGVHIKAIAYKGTTPALTDVMAGTIPLVCAPLGDLVAQAKAGTITLLAASGKTRNAMVQDVPTFIEQGFQIEGAGWYGIFAPAKTPAAQIDKLNRTLVEAIHGDAFGTRARGLWLLPTGTTPAELGAIQKADFDRWAPVIKAAGLVE